MPSELLAVILVVLLVFSLSMSLWLATSLKDSRNYLLDQIRSKDQMIEKLQNKLLARDAMTYATLTQVENSVSTFSEPYIPTGTDEIEYRTWLENNGRSTEGLDDDTDDLAELGLT